MGGGQYNLIASHFMAPLRPLRGPLKKEKALGGGMGEGLGVSGWPM